MKIKDVCVQTGLTDRAVRFYIEKGLLSPDAQRKGGRQYRDYTHEDVRRLLLISTLRKAGFSIDEIAGMQQDPGIIARTAEARCGELERDMQSQDALARRLRELSRRPFSNWEHFASCVGERESAAPTRVDFGRFDEEKELSPQEKESLERFLHARSEAGWKKRRLMRLVAAAVLALMLIAAGAFIYDANRPLYAVSFFASACIEKKRAGAAGFFVCLSSPEEHGNWSAFSPEPGVWLRVEDYTLYQAAITGYEYPAATVRVTIKNRVAQRLGIVQNGFLDLDLLLSNPSLVQEFGVLTGLQGDMG